MTGRRNPFGVNPGASTRSPQPVGTPQITLIPTRPVVYLDSSFSAAEQATIVAALQQISGDKLTQTGNAVFSDGLARITTRSKGTILVRGLQHATSKVYLVPQTGSFIPDTKQAGTDVQVEVAFSSGGLITFNFFTITGANVPGPGGNKIEKCPGYIPIAHELVHAFRMLRHAQVTGVHDHVFADPSGNQFRETVALEELRVTGMDGVEAISENAIRAEQGLGMRLAYASPDLPLDKQGVKPVGAQPSWWPDCPTP